MKFPKELESFSPTLFPEQPGCTMNVDVLKRAGQLILVSVDLFSNYVTGCFANSETSEDLATAIIQAVTPIRRSISILVRVDKAPGLVKLANSKQSILSEVGITLAEVIISREPGNWFPGSFEENSFLRFFLVIFVHSNSMISLKSC